MLCRPPFIPGPQISGEGLNVVSKTQLLQDPKGMVLFAELEYTQVVNVGKKYLCTRYEQKMTTCFCSNILL